MGKITNSTVNNLLNKTKTKILTIVPCDVKALVLTTLCFIAVTAFPSVRAAEDIRPTALIELDGTASEAYDATDILYEWSQIDGPRVELSDPYAAKPYFRTGEPGLYRFQLIVTANSLRSEPFIVEIMIERDNQPPVAQAPEEVRGEVGVYLEVDGSASFDPEGGNLGYRWRLLSGGDPGIPAEAFDQPTLAFVPKQDGVYELELIVTDGETTSAPIISRLFIKPQPRPPVAKARAIAREIPVAKADTASASQAPKAKPVARIEGPAVTKKGEAVMLDARGSSGSDEGKKLSYLWRQKSGPFISNFEMVHDGAAERFVPPRSGDYEFELVIAEGAMESAPAIHSLKVINEAQPPVAMVTAPERAAPGSLVKLDASGSYDLEGSKLAFRWRQTGGPKVTKYLIDDDLGDAAPGFHPPSPGKYSFELIVSNGNLSSKPIDVDIEVGDVASQLALAIEGPQVVNAGETFRLGALFEGPSGKRIVLNWRQVEGPSGVQGNPEGDSLVLNLSQPGRYIFDVSAVEDGRVAATARQVVEAFRVPGRQQMTAVTGAPAAAAAAAVPDPVMSLPTQVFDGPSGGQYLPPPPVSNAPSQAGMADMASRYHQQPDNIPQSTPLAAGQPESSQLLLDPLAIVQPPPPITTADPNQPMLEPFVRDPQPGESRLVDSQPPPYSDPGATPGPVDVPPLSPLQPTVSAQYGTNAPLVQNRPASVPQPLSTGSSSRAAARIHPSTLGSGVSARVSAASQDQPNTEPVYPPMPDY